MLCGPPKRERAAGAVAAGVAVRGAGHAGAAGELRRAERASGSAAQPRTGRTRGLGHLVVPVRRGDVGRGGALFGERRRREKISRDAMECEGTQSLHIAQDAMVEKANRNRESNRRLSLLKM